MEFGTTEIQIFVSLVVVLGVAFVALICDYLKGANEQLRERNIELRVRHEEREYRDGGATLHASAPAKAVVDSRPAQLSTTPASAPTVAATPAADTTPHSETASTTRIETPPPQEPPSSGPIERASAERATNVTVIPVNTAVASSVATVAGPAILTRVEEEGGLFSGVAAMVAISELDAHAPDRSAHDDALAGMQKHLNSLVGPNDSVQRLENNEFLLLYPGQSGDGAQKRLFQLSERLWDYQLRSLGNVNLSFSWGGLEVSSMTLEEVTTAARDRMYQSRRTRSIAALDSATRRTVRA